MVLEVRVQTLDREPTMGIDKPGMRRPRYPRWAIEEVYNRTYCIATHKICLPSRTQAKKQARYMELFHNLEFRFYTCPFCKQWHTTSQPARARVGKPYDKI